MLNEVFANKSAEVIAPRSPSFKHHPSTDLLVLT